MRLLALSGSLRKASYNAAAIEALRMLAPNEVEIIVGSIQDLPLFNPDREAENIPALIDLKSGLNDTEGLIIASPEYAHGISGPMKNALDWLVSGVEFPGKPIMLINTSPRASHAIQALREVLITMSVNIIETACRSIPLLGSGLDKDGILADREIASALKSGVDEFYRQISEQKIKK